jgi:hypothetical protein
MAELLIESGDFATDSVLILASREFTGVVEVRFAFTVTENPNGFVARALGGSDPAGVGALIRGTGVHVVVPGQIPAGSYVFQIESQGGTVATSSYSIFVRDPGEPDPGRGGLGITEPPITDPPLKVVKEDEENAPGYHDSR